jgi:diguanylate cyclase (GGDEF)-like protein
VGDVPVRDGARLDALRWRATVVAGAESREVLQAELPWIRAIQERKPVLGVPMQLALADRALELQVSCSPVRDGHGAVRGCLVSLADQTPVVRANAGLRSAVAELRASREEIERKSRALERLAMVDPLTECLNRRAFARAAGPLFARALLDGEPMSVLVADIDRFKSINDRFGHAVGDEVIRALGAALTGLARPGDLAARWGGEEFVLLLPGCDADAAESTAERIRAAVASQYSDALGARHPGLRFTVSIGVASVGASTGTLEVLIEYGDIALYHAKRAGRDRVARHDRLPGTEPADRDAPSPLNA